MNKLTFQLPESLHRSIQALAEREGYSIDQFLASAAEKMAALRTLDYLRREAAAAAARTLSGFWRPSRTGSPSRPIACPSERPRQTAMNERLREEIYTYPLRQTAVDTLNRQLRSGIADDNLAELVVELRAEGRLCIIHEEEMPQNPKLFARWDSRAEG